LLSWEPVANSLKAESIGAGAFMVEGLRSSRPLVKFRRVLPVAAVLFVAITTARYFSAPPRVFRIPGGAILSNGHRTRPAVVSTAINLPAFLLALPLELAIFRGDPRRNAYYEPFRTIEFALLGIFFWFSAGRALDDWVAWRQLRSGSRWRLSDCLVAALIAIESSLLAVLFAVGFTWARAELWYLASSIGWALLGYWAFLFRIMQLRAYPRAKMQAG
jgi:hypothetical protein